MQNSDEVIENWNRYLRYRKEVDLLEHTLLLGDFSAISGLVKEALATPERRLYALEFAARLEVEQRKTLLPELLAIACHVGPYIFRSRDVIMSLPAEWLVKNIEHVASPILENGDEEAYRRILELYARIDAGLTRRLAEQAVSHSSPQVQDVGKEFLSNRAEMN